MKVNRRMHIFPEVERCRLNGVPITDRGVEPLVVARLAKQGMRLTAAERELLRRDIRRALNVKRQRPGWPSKLRLPVYESVRRSAFRYERPEHDVPREFVAAYDQAEVASAFFVHWTEMKPAYWADNQEMREEGDERDARATRFHRIQNEVRSAESELAGRELTVADCEDAIVERLVEEGML